MAKIHDVEILKTVQMPQKLCSKLLSKLNGGSLGLEAGK